MKRITIVRHAESVSNAGGVTMEHGSIPLSERGRRQASLLAGLLPGDPSLVLVSPMIRTQQTAMPYCERHDVQRREITLLAEFSVVCASLITGLSGVQRKPFVTSYWDDPDPTRRLGSGADTFLEFHGRVRAFMASMTDLPDATLVFGHGIWFGLLLWCLMGYEADARDGMQSFRRFQQALPMPNCAVFHLYGEGARWSVNADTAVARKIAAVT